IISIGMGNGALSFAEQWIPSGMASLFICTSPFWMVGIDWVLPGGKKPGAGTLRGLLVGLAGVAFLVAPTAIAEGLHGGTMGAFLLLQLGTAGWQALSCSAGNARTYTPLSAAPYNRQPPGCSCFCRRLWWSDSRPMSPCGRAWLSSTWSCSVQWWVTVHLSMRWTSCRWRLFPST